MNFLLNDKSIFAFSFLFSLTDSLAKYITYKHIFDTIHQTILHNRTEQNRTEQNRTEHSLRQQFDLFFFCPTKYYLPIPNTNNDDATTL